MAFLTVLDALSSEVNELVSDRVGLPPKFGFCWGGLGGGAFGLEGRAVAIEAGLLGPFETFFRGVIGGGKGALAFLCGLSEMVAIETRGWLSTGVASDDLQTGKRSLTSRFDCKMGPEMSSLDIFGLSLLLTEDVGEERPSKSLDVLRSFFSDCDLLTIFDLSFCILVLLDTVLS